MIAVSAEVEEAIRRGTAVALETSVVAHGLSHPHNVEAARRCANAVRETGAVPAPVAIVAGRIVVGVSDSDLQRLADPSTHPAKAGVRDLAAVCAAKRDAGTTVSATCAVASQVGIRVFATGGIGGVHRRGSPADPLDVSADLPELSRAKVCVVCAGPKVILDVAATAEALEALGVPVLGFGTAEMPAFYTDKSGIKLEHRFDDPAAIVHMLRVHWDELRQNTGVLVCVPPPSPLPQGEIERAVAAALEEALQRRLSGKELTPFLLGAVARATSGRTLAVNLDLLENNARIAARIAMALADTGGRLRLHGDNQRHAPHE
jgi:pseudouridine-5'-phosphate glycosidase